MSNMSWAPSSPSTSATIPPPPSATPSPRPCGNSTGSTRCSPPTGPTATSAAWPAARSARTPARPRSTRSSRSAHRPLTPPTAGSASSRPGPSIPRDSSRAGPPKPHPSSSTTPARSTCVNGGGDLQIRGQAAPGTPWRIGIAHPLRPGELVTVITAHHDLAVATSGTAERGAHILNPHHGTAATTFASLTLIGPRLTMTDAYATAAFARGDGAQNWLDSLGGYEALAVLPDGHEWRTPGFRRYGAGGPERGGDRSAGTRR